MLITILATKEIRFYVQECRFRYRDYRFCATHKGTHYRGSILRSMMEEYKAEEIIKAAILSGKESDYLIFDKKTA